MCQGWVTDLLIYMTQTMNWKNEAAVGAARCLALGHPVRWAMLWELAREALAAIEATATAGESVGTTQAVRAGTVPVSEMAARLGMKRPAVANHLPQMLAARVLEVFPDAAGDGRKRCLGLLTTATVRAVDAALEVDFGDLVLRFPKAAA